MLVKNTTEITEEHHVSHVEKGFLFRLQNLPPVRMVDVMNSYIHYLHPW